MLDAAWFLSEINGPGGEKRVNKKQSLEINSAASSGGEGKLTLHLVSAWGGIVNLKRELFCRKRLLREGTINSKGGSY
jgi:hypothetical protein